MLNDFHVKHVVLGYTLFCYETCWRWASIWKACVMVDFNGFEKCIPTCIHGFKDVCDYLSHAKNLIMYSRTLGEGTCKAITWTPYSRTTGEGTWGMGIEPNTQVPRVNVLGALSLLNDSCAHVGYLAMWLLNESTAVASRAWCNRIYGYDIIL